MNVLTALQSFFDGRAPARPDTCTTDFEAGHDIEDSHELKTVPAGDSGGVDHDIVGGTIGIEYVDAGGQETRRWVSVSGVKESSGGKHSLFGFCYMRMKPRAFRLDRIKSVFDSDGVVYEPAKYFEIAGLEFSAPAQKVVHPGVKQRKTCRDGIRVLTALARIDGSLHPDEVEVVQAYIEAQCAAAKVSYTAEDRDALGPYIKRMQPTGNVVWDALGKLSDRSDIEIREFIYYATKVMDADSIQDEAEARFMIDVMDKMGR